jgi:predicted NBD/HSP70 family sugar kinase
LAQEIGVTRPAITHIVSELLSKGLIQECGLTNSSLGRKPELLELNQNAGYAIGIDLKQRDCLVAALVNLNCEIITKYEFPLADTTPPVIIENIKIATHKLIDETGVPKSTVFGLGISLPDYIDRETGVVLGIGLYDPNWAGVPLGLLVGEATSIPVFVENEACAAALGEYLYGKYDLEGDIVYISIGRGVGSGIIIDGKLFTGADGLAGHFGHMLMREDRSILFELASEFAVLKWVRAEINKGRPTSMLSPVLDISTIYHFVQIGDPLAQEAISVMGLYLSNAVASLINILNPKAVIIGGGAWPIIDYLLEIVRKTVAEKCAGPKSKKTKIISSSLGENTGVIGASTLVLEEIFSAPVFEKVV